MRPSIKGRRPRGRERGAAAVEFAIVAPIFIVLIGAMVNFGLALQTRFLLSNVASSAARMCVLHQPGNQPRAALQTCAIQEATNQLNTNFPSLCPDNVINADALPGVSVGQTNASGVQVYQLILRISCNKSLFGLINAAGGNSLTTLRLNVSAAMPFLTSF